MSGVLIYNSYGGECNINVEFTYLKNYFTNTLLRKFLSSVNYLRHFKKFPYEIRIHNY